MTYRVTLWPEPHRARRLRRFSPGEAERLVATVRRSCPSWQVTCVPRGGRR
jgi:hypothetical protein